MPVTANDVIGRATPGTSRTTVAWGTRDERRVGRHLSQDGEEASGRLVLVASHRQKVWGNLENMAQYQ